MTKKRHTYAPLFFLLGIAGGIWFWFYMNIAMYNFRTISLFEAVTNENLLRANDIYMQPLSQGSALALAALTTFLAAAAFAGIGAFIKR